MKKNIRNKLKIILILVILIVGLCIFYYFSNDKESIVVIEKGESVEKIKEEINPYQELIDIYEKNKSINDDYVGQIYFESGLIDLPFVKGDNNNTYFRTNWETMKYDIGGSIFMDSRNDIEKDQNVIIYGHNFDRAYDSSGTQKFTPLNELTNKDKYEDNKYVNLFIKDILYKYEIVSVYKANIEEDETGQYIAEGEPIYVLTSYSPEELNTYKDAYKQREYYNTGIEINDSDKLLTLQTCIDGEINKLIVLAKLIQIENAH